MRAIAVQPDDDLRRRIDRHLAERADEDDGTENEMLCELLRRGLAATEDGPDAEPGATADHEEAIAERVDDVVDALYATDGAA